MDWPVIIRDSARRAGHALDQDVVEELATHAQAAFDAACARGGTTVEAEAHVGALIHAWIDKAAALRRLPRRPAAVEPPPSGLAGPRGLTQDLRYAARLVVRQRGFGLLAILTMALAIGVMTTLFSVVYGVLLRPLPWPESDRLVRLSETHIGATRQMPLTISNVAYRQWAEAPTTVETIAGWSRTSATLTLAGATDRVSLSNVTPSTFSLLRAVPLLGQVFTDDHASEVVLSYGFWQERFGGDPSALGRVLQLNGKSYTVTGVMPRDFLFPDRETKLWRPMTVPSFLGEDGRSVSMFTFSAMARLKPGVTPERAAAEATERARTGFANGLAASSTGGSGGAMEATLLAFFGSAGPADISAVPALDALTSDVKPGLIALAVAVSLLLLTAIANIASLQLARATTRYREMAIRSAIGAGTGRLVQQLLVENVLLATTGGAVGLLLSAGLHRLLPSVLPADFPRLDSIGLHSTVALFTVVVTGLTGVMLGVLPALHLRRLRLVEALTENSSGVLGGTRARTRTIIMTGQVAIACTLLIGAVLLARSFVAMAGQDRGYDPSHMLTARLSLPDYAFKPDTRLQTLETFLIRARTLPSAPTVALTTGLPLSYSENLSGFTMPSVQPPAGTPIQVHTVRSVVTPDYFAALGLRLAQGRTFRPDDDSLAAPKVVMVNRTFAKQYLVDPPIGNRIRNFMRDDGIDFEVIGVMDDVVKKGLADTTQPEIYSLLHQSTGPAPNHEVVIRTTGDPSALIQPLRALVKQIAPGATVESVRTMDDRIAGSIAKPRLYAVLLLVFAISALAIASIGLFAVLSYVVAQRSREIALRSALGARPGQIFGLVFTHGMLVTLGGLALGVVTALASVRYLKTLLYGVSSHDTVTFVAVAVVITAIAVVACLGPALRAMRIDPLKALRA